MRSAKTMRALLFLFILPCLASGQQQDDTTNTSATKNQFSAAVNYQSRLHYFGRTDSLKSSGIFPSINFQLKQGLYINADFIFQNNSSLGTQYTGTTLEAGFKFPETEHFNGNIFFSKFLYNNKSTLVQSSIKSQAGINVAFPTSAVTLNLAGDAKFSDQTDFGATAGLDHLFLLTNIIPNAVLALDPSVYAYAGSQNFTKTYYQKQNILFLPIGQQQAVTEESKKFSLLAYEASLPVVLVAGKFNFSFIPSYIMPQNLVSVPNRTDLSETGKNMFYFIAGVGVKL